VHTDTPAVAETRQLGLPAENSSYQWQCWWGWWRRWGRSGCIRSADAHAAWTLAIVV